MVGIDSKYRYRAEIRRDVAKGRDEYGQENAGDWQLVGIEVPCYFWHKNEAVSDGTRDGVILTTVVMAAFPFTADVRDGDRVTIHDQQGDEVIDEHDVDGTPAREKRYRRAKLRRYHGEKV